MIKLIRIVILCLGIMSLTACSLLPQQKNEKTVLLKPVLDKINLLELERGSISNEIEGVGTLVPHTTKYLHFITDGRLADIAFHPGDLVHKGEIVLRLDEGDLSLQIKEQQLVLENLRGGFANSQVADQTAASKINKLNVEIGQMQLKALTDKFSKLQIISPIDGIISFLDPFQQGDWVSAYSSVIGIASMQLRVQYIKDEPGFSNGIDVNMPVSVMYHNQMYEAKVTATRNDHNQEAVLIDFKNEPLNVSLGDYADFKIIAEKKENVIKIPLNALHISTGSNFVRVMEGNRVNEVDVQTGLFTATEVEIVKGLKEHQQIVLN